MIDLLVRGGQLLDGTGNPWYRGDVAVQAGKIAAIGSMRGVKAARTIEAEGLAVAPGFIDIHSHSDTILLANPLAESKVRQGVTTEVVGNCGNSAAPLAGVVSEEIQETMCGFGLDLTWQSMGEYLDCAATRHLSVNLAALVGHGTLRKAVMGYADRAPTPAELAAMQDLLSAAMEAGAFGMSTGLIYPPGVFSRTDELIAICEAIKPYGGIYTSHIRNEGKDLLAAVTEAIAIGESSGVPVQISHHKAASALVWGKVAETLGMIDAARARGVDVTADQYPYVATSTTLTALLPNWAHAEGGDGMRRYLRDPAQRGQLITGIREKRWYRDDWDKIVIAAVRTEANKGLEGMSLAAIAAARGTTGPDVIIDLLLEEDGVVSMIIFAMCEPDVARVMQHPAVMIGSDGSALAPTGIFGQGKPHPRNYGTFPRVLGKYVREERVITLEDAVRKMTSLPAGRLGLPDRGLLRPGLAADITVFDPATVRDGGDFTDPHRYPDGIEYVIVNGVVTIERGAHTQARAGQVLRHGK